MFAEFVKEESIEEIGIRIVVIMLLLYIANDALVLIAKIFMGRCTKAYEGINKILLASKLTINSSKTMIMLLNNLNKYKSCIMYNNAQLKTVESFKCLGI